MSSSADYHRQYDTYDFADFAQEFLRRNPEYRAQYNKLDGSVHLAPDSKACKEMAHSWGLEFPFRTRLERIGKPCILARMRSTLDRHPRNRRGSATSGSTSAGICKS